MTRPRSASKRALPADIEDPDSPIEEQPSKEECGSSTEQERRERNEIAPYLLRHAYHLPGNNLVQDFWQYQMNNYPVFGIFLHHKYHPLSWKIRTISLVGSMLFGLALTSIVYCAFVFVDQDSEQTLLQFTTNVTVGTTDLDLQSTVSSVSVTTGNLVLWFVAAPIHGVFDSLAWLLTGCTCIQFTRADSRVAILCRKSGAFVLSLSIIVIMAVTAFSVMLRASLQADEDIELDIVGFVNASTTTMNNATDFWGDWNNATNVTTITTMIDPTASGRADIMESHTQVQAQLESLYQEQNFEDYKFVISYLVELVLVYLIYYPLVETIFFSGILAKCCCCSNWPMLAGRSYELQQAALEEPIEEGIEVEYKPTESTASE